MESRGGTFLSRSFNDNGTRVQMGGRARGVAQSRKPIKLISESGSCAIGFVIMESNGFGAVVVFFIHLIIIMVFLFVFGFYSDARVGVGSVFLL